jgi:ferrochelatase
MSDKTQSSKYAVVLVYLGTPSKPAIKAVRVFLRRFLSDSRVVEAPKALWFFILNLIILPLRPAKIVKVYKKMWLEYGDSPLRLISQKQHDLLQAKLDEEYGCGTVSVYTATSYSENSIASTLEQIQQEKIGKVVVLPLYPQYSATTTGAVYDQVARYILKQRDLPELHLVKQYYDYPGYRQALAASVSQYWQANGPAELLLTSFHGIPQSYVDKGDPYYQQCVETARSLAQDLRLDDTQWRISFQSNVGRALWLKPYTSELLKELAEKGVKTVDVVCPAFSADCIETLDEIGEENRLVFESAGGQRLRLIPCLNDRDDHLELFKNRIKKFLD